MLELDPSRSQRFTASMAPWLMSGSHEVIQRLWLRAIGDPRYKPDDFEHSWAARYGIEIEKLAKRWVQEHGYELTDLGKQFFHPTRKWCSGTFDARVISRNGVPCNCAMDCKAINAFRDTNEATTSYTAQLAVQQECGGTDQTSLLIVKGGGEPFEVPVYIDENYRALMWDTIDHFWHCVETLTPPVPLRFPRIVPPDKWRRIDLDRDADLPNWADEMRALLDGWGNTEESARAYEQFKIDIKGLFPDDCGRLVSASYVVARTRNNSVTIKRRKTHG